MLHNHTNTKITFSKFLAILLLLPGMSQAALMFQNFSLTTTQLSFDLVGTVDSVLCCDTDSFFFGSTDSAAWLLSSAGGTFTNNSGTYVVTSVGANPDDLTWGDYAFTNSSSPITVGMTVNFSYVLNGSFAPDTLTTFVAQAGYDGTYTKILKPENVSARIDINQVPAPATLALLGLGLAGLGWSRRKNS